MNSKIIPPFSEKVLTLSQFEPVRRQLEAQDKVLVFTNGCFDLLHLGHVTYLQEARNLGDALIIGLNSTRSVQRIKSPLRPVNGEKERALLLAALECVNFVIVFEEDTPEQLIQVVQPDILVKGGDYLPEQIIGKDIVEARGGSVRVIPFLEGYSSTRIMEKAARIVASEK